MYLDTNKTPEHKTDQSRLKPADFRFKNIILPMRTFSCMALFFISIYTICAQTYPCGSVVTQPQIEYEQAFIDSVDQLTEMNRTFHLVIYIVKDNKGQTNVNLTQLNDAIAQLNTAFEPVSTTFATSSLNYIDNYNFDEIHMGTNEENLFAQFATRNTINIYIVNKLYNSANQQIGGYAYYPAEGRDAILLQKNCLSGAFLTEQLGHFFNLYHTHETAFGSENVRRANCGHTGDLCCDTPADPGLSGNVTADCQYTGTGRDANGTYYIVTTYNFMCFSPLSCRCYFSEDQYIRMNNCMLRTKNYLW